MVGRWKRKYRGYRKIMWQKRGEEKVEKCGNTHELQASHSEQGRETKIQIWRNTRRKKRVKHNTRPSGMCTTVCMCMLSEWAC